MSIKLLFQQYGYTFLLCVIFFLILTPRQFGYLFILVALATLLWILVQIPAFNGKDAGKIAIRISMLLVTFLLIGIFYQQRIDTEKSELNALVKSIEIYKAQHGSYPVKLEDADKTYLQKTYIRYGVSNQTTTPRLLYISSFQTIDGGYLYDFKKHVWQAAGD